MEKQKKLVSNLKGTIIKKDKELENVKFSLLEKDQEILYLRSYLKSLKLDRKIFYF